jgi:hypothetical protein
MAAPQQISHQTVEEFRAIYHDKFGDELSDAEVHEIALGYCNSSVSRPGRCGLILTAVRELPVG